MYAIEFVELAGIMRTANEKVNKIRGEVNDYEDKTYEDRVLITAIDILTEAFEQANKQISAYLPEYTTGCLKKQSNGRFVLNNIELTCGRYLELYVDGSWMTGRVEFSEDYYFHNALMNNPSLKTGMKARTIT